MVFEIARGHHHLMRAFHQQPGEANGIRRVLPVSLDQILRRDLDTEVDHAIAVVRQDDFYQVLADIVYIAFYGGEHDLAAARGFGLFQELLGDS